MLSKNQIKELQRLKLKKFRDHKQLFIAEGVKSVTEIITRRPALIEQLFATGDFIASAGKLLASAQLTVTEVSPVELEKISLQSTPNKALAVCHYFKEPDISYDFKNCFSLYLDDIRDPGNFGTIMRLADWFGISKIFCSPMSCDLYNPKVIQASMGAFLRVEVVYEELQTVIETNRLAVVYGALLNGKNLYSEKLTNGLVVIGNEANGINENNLDKISRRISIPAHRNNGTESLNAAMAASIIASEFYRQLSNSI